jgi:small redox-active disulfide protein 2
MKNIKVLGPGCANCKTTAQLITAVAEEQGIAIELEKIEELREIMSFGILATPGVVVDGKVVHSGGIPSREKVAQWLQA